jgi:LysM repeat protein
MFESSVLPLLQGIETQFGEDEAARVGDLIAQLMKEGIARGFESNPVQLMEFILGNVDYRYDEGQARSVTVQAGDTLSAIAQRENVSVQFLAEINKLEDPNMILTGQELVVEVGARVTRLLPPLLPTADEMGLDASTLGMIYGGQTEDGEPMKPLGVEATGLDDSLATAQELQTTLTETIPPVITPAKMGLVSGDVAEVGVVEVIDSIGQKLQDISSRIYQVSMTVNLDANIRTGAGFKIIPISMAEIANDISESARIFRLAQGGR